jgi:hypothetical protein
MGKTEERIVNEDTNKKYGKHSNYIRWFEENYA